MKKQIYEIVDFDEKYIDYLFMIHKENFIEYFIAHYGKWNDNRQFKSFCKMVHSGHYKMIKYDGQIIGMINYQEGTGYWGAVRKSFEANDYKNLADYIIPAQIRYINLDKKYQGQGIGTAIIRDIVEECKERRYCYAILKVYKDNEEALRLYKGAGFVEDEANSDEHYSAMRLQSSGYYAYMVEGGRNARIVAPIVRESIDRAFCKEVKYGSENKRGI